ncbi:MAG TPA: hypothetical protein VGU71_22390 [Candidatus Dormibacteraeota bacterium]|nr:hypothetical protein [Candidatus Dormibacteraeota bacterium]
MIWNLIFLGVVIGAGIGGAGRDAWLDRTPRSMAQREPWWLRQANAPFWVHRRSPREAWRHVVQIRQPGGKP